MKKQEEKFTITLKGLIQLETHKDELTERIMDSIELYLRRHHSAGGSPGIVLDMETNKFEFVTLEKQE